MFTMMSLKEIFSEFFTKISEIFTSLPQNVSEIMNSPLSLLTLIAFAIILVLMLKAKKIKFNPKMTAMIGLTLALTTILDLLKIYHFPQGGGVTLASMVPIILLSYIYGPLVGMLTGFLFGILSLFFNPYILHPVQVLFDYPLPYLALGIAGFFPNKRILGAVTAIFSRYFFHFISGVVFFGSFAPDGMSPWLYSLSVNGLLGLAEGAICIIVLCILPVDLLIKSAGTSYTGSSVSPLSNTK